MYSLCTFVLVSELPRLKVHRVTLGQNHSNLLRKCLVYGIDLDIIVTVGHALELGHECMGEASLSVISLCVHSCWWGGLEATHVEALNGDVFAHGH